MRLFRILLATILTDILMSDAGLSMSEARTLANLALRLPLI